MDSLTRSGKIARPSRRATFLNLTSLSYRIRRLGKLDDDIRNPRIGANGAGIEQRAIIDLVRAATKDLVAVLGDACRAGALAKAGRSFIGDSEQHRNVFVTVKPVGNEERDYDHVRSAGEQLPVGDERLFLHVDVEDVGIAVKVANFFRFAFCRDGAVLV